MNTARTTCIALWLSCGLFLSAAMVAHAGVIAPETPQAQAEAALPHPPDNDAPGWKPVDESDGYGAPAAISPDQVPWHGERTAEWGVETLLSTQQLFGPDLSRQLDQDSDRSVEDLLSLESLTPSVPGPQVDQGVRPQGNGRSRAFDLAEEILQPIKIGDGVISFSIAGIGNFVVRRDKATGDLHIQETSSSLATTVKQSTLQGMKTGTENGAANARRSEAETTLTFRALAGKIFDLLFGGPQILILFLVFGLWVTFRIWLRMRTRSRVS